MRLSSLAGCGGACYTGAMPAFQYSAAAGKSHLPYLRKWLPKAAALIRSTPDEVSIALVGDTVMSRLHKEYLDIAGPTDVLTFEIEFDASGRVKEGEVVVCVPEATRRAAEHKHTVRDELLLYALHGLLHLCGYDDRTDAAYRRMHRKEDDILRRLGIGPIFAAGSRPRKRK
jgi:probable rRNA maturation factor